MARARATTGPCGRRPERGSARSGEGRRNPGAAAWADGPWGAATLSGLVRSPRNSDASPPTSQRQSIMAPRSSTLDPAAPRGPGSIDRQRSAASGRRAVGLRLCDSFLTQASRRWQPGPRNLNRHECSVPGGLMSLCRAVFWDARAVYGLKSGQPRIYVSSRNRPTDRNSRRTSGRGGSGKSRDLG